MPAPFIFSICVSNGCRARKTAANDWRLLHLHRWAVPCVPDATAHQAAQQKGRQALPPHRREHVQQRSIVGYAVDNLMVIAVDRSGSADLFGKPASTLIAWQQLA